MARRYTAEEACAAILNDDLDEMNSADSLDESFSESSSSTSELDSNPEEDYAGRTINVQVPLPTRGRPSASGGARARGGTRTRVRTRGGRARRGRGVRTRGASNNERPRPSSPNSDSDPPPNNDQPEANNNLSNANNDPPNAGSSDESGEDPWKNEPPSIKDFPFNEQTGISIDVPEGAKPMFFFNLLLTDNLVDDLVAKTNQYAQKSINSVRPLRRRSVWNSWTDVDADEMKKFIGLLFSMGLVSLPSYKKYWSTDVLYKNENFATTMSRERFESILRFFNFGEKPKFDGDRLSKIRMIMDHFNETMLRLITPDKNLSIDESMMLWRGRLVFRQYIKNKRHKYGIKFYELCTHDGLVMTVEIYGGQHINDEHSLGQTGATVLKLMQPFLDKGYHVFTDNYYNSVALTNFLTTKKTYITGTLRSDRKGNPKKVISSKLRKGQMIWQSKDDVSVAKWKDKRPVLMISNAHVPNLTNVTNRRGQEKQKPNLVKDYNDCMSGIDRSDQMMSYHSGLRKTVRWYKKAGVHFLEMFLTNAYYLYRKFSTDNEFKHQLDFKENVIKSLIGERKRKKHMEPTADFHYLEPIPAGDKKKYPTRRCKQCWKTNTRKESRFVCGFCEDKPPLCVHPCFNLYHKQLGIVENEEEIVDVVSEFTV